jgi:DNA replication protein DnaC
MSASSTLAPKLAHLKLRRIADVVDQWIEHAEAHQLGYGEFLDELLNEELLTRQENQIRRKLQAAGFPFAATLEQFEFSLRPELKRAVMMRFFDSAFIEKAGSLILIGPSGVGKTHLVVAVGTKMVQLGYNVRFLTAQQFAHQVLAATTRVETERVLQPLVRCDLLILDEFGYLPIDSRLGPALYELISGRYGKRATAITSNKSLANWGEVIGGDTALMMAILDRLLHHGEVFYLRGASVRLRGKEAVLPPVAATPAPDVPAASAGEAAAVLATALGKEAAKAI